MKKNLKNRLLAAVFTLAALLTACSKSAPEAEEAETDEEISAGVPLGVVLDRAGVWELQNDGKLKWVRYINAGETVEWKDEKRTLVNTSNNKENDYYRVYAGGDYWIRDYAVTGPARPGVIIYPDTVLYSRPDLGSPVTTRIKTLHQYSVVAVHEEDPAAVAQPAAALQPDVDFVQVSAYYIYNGQYYVVNKSWVKSENVSTLPGDVKGVSLYRLALATEDPVVKRELLNNVLSVSDRYLDVVQRELVEMEYQTESITARTFTVIEEGIYVLDRPDAESAAINDSISYGEKVTATARTREKINYYDMNDYYYRIEKPAGWIFGAYLSSGDKEEAPAESAE
jgi:hypothetical protein